VSPRCARELVLVEQREVGDLGHGARHGELVPAARTDTHRHTETHRHTQISDSVQREEYHVHVVHAMQWEGGPKGGVGASRDNGEHQREAVDEARGREVERQKEEEHASERKDARGQHDLQCAQSSAVSEESALNAAGVRPWCEPHWMQRECVRGVSRTGCSGAEGAV
jgi:hypothetical protein